MHLCGYECKPFVEFNMEEKFVASGKHVGATMFVAYGTHVGAAMFVARQTCRCYYGLLLVVDM